MLGPCVYGIFSPFEPELPARHCPFSGGSERTHGKLLNYSSVTQSTGLTLEMVLLHCSFGVSRNPSVRVADEDLSRPAHGDPNL